MQSLDGTNKYASRDLTQGETMRTYYNDNDPYCCQVIRKNIHLGFLPEGHVDERTIQDVTWEDIALYQHVHLFADESQE